jgi:hypothetical protein
MAEKIIVINTNVGDLVAACYDELEPLPIPTKTKTAMIGTLVQDARRNNGRRRTDLLHNAVR